MCDQNNNLMPQNGFTPICPDGSTPGCTGYAPVCPNGNTPMMIANKYISAIQAKQGTQPYLTNITKLGSSPIFYDLVDCGGAPCACVDSNNNPIANGAPLCQANSTLTQGIFQLPSKVCSSGTLSNAQPLYMANVTSSGLAPSSTA